MKKFNEYNEWRITAIVLLLVIALNALAAGFSFMVEPSGKDIGISTDYLRYSPFDNFLVPGIVLFLVNGVLGIVTAVLSIRKAKHYPVWIIMQGVLLIGWIVVQIIMIRDFHWMHMACLVIGGVLVVIGGLLNKDRKRQGLS